MPSFYYMCVFENVGERNFKRVGVSDKGHVNALSGYLMLFTPTVQSVDEGYLDNIWKEHFNN